MKQNCHKNLQWKKDLKCICILRRASGSKKNSLEPTVGLTSNQAVNSNLSVEIYLRKLIDSDHEGCLEAPFSPKVQGPQKPLSKGQEDPPGPGIWPIWPNECSETLRGPRKYYNVEKVKTAWKTPEKYQKFIFGALLGPLMNYSWDWFRWESTLVSRDL